MNSNMITKRRRRRHDETDVHEGWSKYLPNELIESIVKRLGLFGLMSSTLLCSSWSIVATALRRKQRFENQFPCIIQSVPSDLKCFSIFSPAENISSKKLTFPIQDAILGDTVSYCSGSCGSWLIIVEHSRNPETTTMSRSYFFNPVSGARIALPSLMNSSFFTREDRGRRKSERVFINSVASSSPTDPNCVVAAIALHGYSVAFCMPNNIHASWTLQPQPFAFPQGFTDLHFHEGKLYATLRRRFDVVNVFDPLEVFSQGFNNHVVQVGNVLEVKNHRHVVWDKEHDPCFCFITSLRGELLLVLKGGSKYSKEVFFNVYRFEITMENGTNSIRRLKYEHGRVTNMGEQAIFVSNVGGGKSLMGMAIPTNSREVKDEFGAHANGNYIYFTNEKDDRIGVCNIDDRTLKYYLSHGRAIRGRSKVWFTPEMSM